MRNRAILAGFVALLTVVSALAIIPAMPAAAADNEDVLYVAMQEDLPDYNNYNLGSNSVWKANVIGYCFEGLAGTDYDRKPFELLAEKWTFEESTLTVTIDIRQNVKFHDGTVMDADDVIFSYLMARGGTTYSDRIIQAFDDDDIGEVGFGVVDEIELNAGIKKVNDYRITMTMAKAYGQFFTSTLSLPIVPKAIWENHVLPGNLTDVTWGTDTDALIGTGPYVYAGGVPNSYRLIETFDDYWGKDFKAEGSHWLTPYGMPTYPWVLDAVHYKIYASIDTAILALQGGEVDYIAWAVTAGRVPSLQSDPNIELEYMSDSGYRYLAFNMKKEPMANLSFRRAVSHLIDKDQIVDVYMGGFGQAGSSAVPPFYDAWYDPTVKKYAFDIEIAKSILATAGYEDKNGDGWLELPDGRLMEKITLMTPPADYDPIRIRAGQMIATNMRAVGINVEAKPIDFNTLVAKLTAYDYQMLTLGWKFTGYTECVSLLFDIYSPTGSSNSWGWWSLANPSPFYADLGGVSTLADEYTQALADEFLAVEGEARANFSVASQIDFTKQGQQLVAEADVCDVLFYQVNVEAHNKVWTNWTIFDGQLINAFSWTTLIYASAGGASGGGAVATVSAGLTLPGKVVSGDSVTANVMVIDNLGKPVANATIAVNVTGGGVVASPTTGTTNADGLFSFAVQGTAVGISTVTVNATLGTARDSDAASIRTYTKGGIGVVVTPEHTSVAAGETIDVTCTVKDANGPVAGASVTIDKYLMGYGTITPEVATTGANGVAAFTYTARAEDLTNQHMLVTLSATVAKDGYLYSNVGAASLVVYNDAAPDWYMVTVDSVTTTALSDAGSNESTITVKLIDTDGTAIVGQTLNVTYSDIEMVFDPVIEVTTLAGGVADVPVQIKDLGESGALRVTVGMLRAANSLSDTVTLTYMDSGSPPAAPMYGGYIQYANPKFVDALGSVDVSIYVFDSDGDPAVTGTSASVFLSATDYGEMTDWDEMEYSTLWDGVGMILLTDADGQNIASAGGFSMLYTDWDFYGVTLTDGVYDMTINGIGLAHLDQALGIYLVPDATGTFDWTTYNYMIQGQTLISSQYGYGRAMEFVGTRYVIDDPVLQARTEAFDETTIDVWVYDESNDLISGADVYVYEKSNLYNPDYGLSPSTEGYTDAITTDADGNATWDIVCAAFDGVNYTLVPAVVTPDLFVRADVDGAISLLSQTQLVMEPIVKVAFAAFEPVTVTQSIGFAATATVVVTDLAGDPVPYLPLSIAVSDGTALQNETMTDGDGKAVFAIDTSGMEGVRAAFVAAVITTAGTYEASGARVMLAVVNDAPAVTLSAPAEDEEVVGPDVTVRGGAFDANGLETLTMSIDGGSAISLAVEADANSAVISRLVEDLAEGEHTVSVVATDSLGISTESEVTFTVVGEESNMLLWAIAGIGWALAVVLLVVLLLKMRKPASPAAEEPAAEAAPEEKA